MPIPAQSNQHYTHSVHQLATSQAFVAQPQQPHPSEDFPSSTHPSNAPTTIQNDGATPKAPHRPNAFMVEDANGGKRKTMADEFRAEVEDRTRNGESCEQICAALNARSIQVTDKTISRWRITWGLRKSVLPTRHSYERANI
ncbi:60S ribosomal protein [Apiospora arundinis]